MLSRFSWKQISSVLGGVILISTAAAAFGINDLKFWVTPDEVREIKNEVNRVHGNVRIVASDSYQSQITQIDILLISAEVQLDQCIAQGKDCTSIIQTIANLRAERERLTRLKAMYGG